MTRYPLVVALALLGFGPTPALAEDKLSPFDMRILQSLTRGIPFADFEQALIQRFQNWEADGVPGFTPEDSVMLETLREASARGHYVGRLLGDDLDGDLVISEEELTIKARRKAMEPLRANGLRLPPSEEQIAYIIEHEMTKHLVADSNGDRDLSLEEVIAYYNKQQENREPNDQRRLPDMTHDVDGDGRLTQNEFVSSMMSLARRVDADGDGTVTEKEYRRAVKKGLPPLRDEGATGPTEESPATPGTSDEAPGD